MQLDLFDNLLSHVTAVYADAGNHVIDNATLYRRVGKKADIPTSTMTARTEIGKSRQKHSVMMRKIRWYQQDLKRLGVLERVGRGAWKLTKEGKQLLHQATPQFAMLGYSTDLGVCIWGTAENVFGNLDRPITLGMSSIPYPLKKPRAYGNPRNEREYVDFACRIIEPVVRNMAPGASLVLNLSNDIFEDGSPARSLYLERLVIALHDELGLKLMDRWIWQNPSKPPGPIQWASKERVHLNVAWEPLLWFTNDPKLVRSNNQRVLKPHTDRHWKLIEAGGEQRNAQNCDGAYQIRAGKSYSNKTKGRIQRNVLTMGHSCASKRATSRRAEELGLPIHGATFPLALARFVVDFFTGDRDDELYADFCSGWNTFGLAAEERGVPWIATEHMLEYVRGGAERFVGRPGYRLNPNLFPA